MANTSNRCRKSQLLWTVLYIICISGTLGSEKIGSGESLPRQKISLQPTTTSVKCKCEEVNPASQDSKEGGLTNSQKDIEIEIFNTESNKQLSERSKAIEADRRRDDIFHPPDKAPNPVPNRNRHQSSFKAYKSADLFGGVTYPSHSTDNVMELGVVSGPFMGPRKRRRRAVKQPDRNVVYVYPVNYYEPTDSLDVQQSETKPEPLVQAYNQPIPIQSNYRQPVGPASTPISNGVINPFQSSQSQFAERNMDLNDLELRDQKLNLAMRTAWEEYGIKSPMRKQATVNPNDQFQSPSTLTGVKPNPFQKTGSEWDHKMTQIPKPIAEQGVTLPGYFAPVLEKYIDFEVNNHEVADTGRKIIFFIFVSTLVIGWVILGMLVGFIPAQWSFFSGKKSSEGSNAKREAGGNLSEITDRIMLALDSGWLKKLEERVRQDPRGDFVRTHAHCCILPNFKTEGMADCQLVRRKSKASNPFKCISDLIYNIEFGENKSEGVKAVLPSNSPDEDDF